MSALPIQHTTVSRIVAHRDAAIAKIEEAADAIEAGVRLAAAAAKFAEQAHGAAAFGAVDRREESHYGRLFVGFDRARSIEAFRRQVDARTWINLVEMTGMKGLMDRTAIDALYKDLAGDVPAVTEDAVWQILGDLVADADLIFARGLARAFIDLDKRFKSHDAFQIGSRMIFTHVFDEWGHWNYHSRMRETLTDVERVFMILDGDRKPQLGGLAQAITESRGGGFERRQSVCETDYFRIRTFKNGNCHLWFTRDDLVRKANEVLADYYGEVLPDGVPREDPEEEIRSKTGALSKDLAFYPTPAKVAQTAIRDLGIGPDSRVLEPSAGTGNIVRELLPLGAQVNAIEVDRDRYLALQAMGLQHRRLWARRGNFLRMEPQPSYTHVVMNPPFYGTHWMQHVVHAMGWLKPGGVLRAILPATAEIGQSKKHEQFRAWAKTQRYNYGRMWVDLPPESFADSGTRVQTVMLTLRKAR